SWEISPPPSPPLCLLSFTPLLRSSFCDKLSPQHLQRIKFAAIAAPIVAAITLKIPPTTAPITVFRVELSSVPPPELGVLGVGVFIPV
ncbi:13414_t:CDS:1, partial [Entrophospora sp. SA101]